MLTLHCSLRLINILTRGSNDESDSSQLEGHMYQDFAFSKKSIFFALFKCVHLNF